MKMEINKKISLEYLGPVVLNTDGSISRIKNWSKLTTKEQEKIMMFKQLLMMSKSLQFDCSNLHLCILVPAR